MSCCTRRSICSQRSCDEKRLMERGHISTAAAADRERPVNQPTELLHPQADVAKHMPLGGSDEVLTNGLKPDLQAAKRLAKRLYNLDGFRKSDVARHLSKNNDFSQMVAHEYLSYFNFRGMNIDQALRSVLDSGNEPSNWTEIYRFWS
ncbi:hypothetical protein ILYODFUR_031708 [Ilyodon furcidens]|uniref:SEC7 domain-containing protein n=1 Tax=Ilyodon furcidens TaxID=33524 RepID=A0ABV0SSI1_9TELE